MIAKGYKTGYKSLDESFARARWLAGLGTFNFGKEITGFGSGFPRNAARIFPPRIPARRNWSRASEQLI